MKICKVDGCDLKVKARTWCRLHYERWQRTGDPINTLIKYGCSIEGCDGKHHANGLCEKHFIRLKIHGNPLNTKRLFNNKEYKSIEEAFWAKVIKHLDKECWDWSGPKNELGYGHLTFDGIINLTHRFSYALHNGPITTGMFVCHHCDNPSCVNPTHLFLGSPNDNVQDKMRKDRHKVAKGSMNSCSKINENDVINIRSRLNKGEKGIALSKEYNVSVMTISNIRLNKSWKHI